jgi:two-component system cell cycle response regulator
VDIKRSKLVAPVLVLILTIAAIAAVWLLVGRASSSREAQLQVSALRLSLADLQSAPFGADPALGGSAAVTRARIRGDERSISAGLVAGSHPGVPPSLLASGRSALAKLKPVVNDVYGMAAQKGGLTAAGSSRVFRLDGLMVARGTALSGVLDRISRSDAARASSARAQTKLGSAAAMLLLLAAFAYFYFRSAAARVAVERLAREKGEEARTDALTSLRNRRALTSDLASAIAHPSGGRELLLAIYDLDGFKQYNDTFGHAAGDALLQRLGGHLASVASAHSGFAYRMGGDEFCMFAACSPETAERLLDETSAALHASGEGWDIGCSHGAAWIPSEAATETQALKLADERMYTNKTRRSSASRQVTDALLQVITEQNVMLDDHVERVSELAVAIAQALGQPEHEVRRIQLAARLHDVGKTAIPAAILDKPGPLDDREWEFMRRHPLIGERIVLAAPALANTADLIHSSHERIDGHGYPDGLTGENIPLGSRIIAVCDAFDAMTSHRVYRKPMSTDAALEQLKRHAGTQFDATIVDTFCQQTHLHHSSDDNLHTLTTQV